MQAMAPMAHQQRASLTALPSKRAILWTARRAGRATTPTTIPATPCPFSFSSATGSNSKRRARVTRRAFPNDGARTASTGDLDPSDREGLLALLRARQVTAAAAAASLADDVGPSRSPAVAPLPSPSPQQPDNAAAPPTTGRVYLVGTGPGDPGLLTLRAAQLIRRADVVLYDRLVSDDVLALAPPSALLVYAGKAAGLHTRPQEEIHALLAAFARAGATVVRLKGGDPFVFGRGGEEAAYLEARGVAVRAVPGVTAAAGIAAELGVPLTHRGVATGVRFLTGHAREGGEAQLEETVEAMLGGAASVGGDEEEAGGDEQGGGGGADGHTTLVVYMGLGTLPALAARLTGARTGPVVVAGAQEGQQQQQQNEQQQGGQEEGAAAAAGHGSQRRARRCSSPSTPAVAVERGTTDDQRVVFGTLGDLSARAGAAGLRSPTLIVVGRVVALSPLWRQWEEAGRPWPRPLREEGAAAGGREAVPCARSDLGDPLRELGLLQQEVGAGALAVERRRRVAA